MWLFVWDSEPSKIFVGDTQISKVFLWDTKIRPKDVWELSTDFTKYTSLAQIQAQWWTWTTNISSTAPTYSYWSNGMGVGASASYGYIYGGIYVKLPSPIADWNKIVMKYNWSISTAQSWIIMTLSTTTKANLATNNQTELNYSQTYRGSASDQWLAANKNVNGTKTWVVWGDLRSIQWTTWTYDAEVILDLSNNTSKWICTSPSWMAYTSESTISSAWKALIIWTEYFIVWWALYERWVARTAYIKNASIKVES